MNKSILVAINGEIFKPADAKISVFDRGFMYGDAVYEVARSYGRVFFELEKHIDRLFNSAAMLSLDLKKTPQAYIDDIYRLYKNIPLEDIYMRIQITRGTGTIGLGIENVAEPNVVIYFRHLEKAPAEYYSQGVKVVTSDRLRNSKKALDPNIKSGNYLNNVLAFMKATESRAFESIMVNAKGEVTEGTTANILMVKDGEVVTTPDDYDILKGITRGIVQQLCAKLKLKYTERGFRPEDLEAADEVFLTSSTKEVLPVATVNMSQIKNSPGPISQKLGQAYKAYIHEYCQTRLHLGK